jgi:mono/diheme cytochrome c family protein
MLTRGGRRGMLRGQRMRCARWLGVVGAVLLAAFSAPAANRRNRSSDGGRLYRSECAPCHGSTGHGDGPEAVVFSSPPADLRTGLLERYDVATVVQRILDGTPLAVTLDPKALMARAADVETIVAYLERLPTIDWSLIERGEEVWVDRCELCHGRFGRPGPTRPPAGVRASRDLSDPSFQKAHKDRELLVLARHGREGMPAIPGPGSDADAGALVGFIRLLSPGYVTYEQYCATCHGDDGRGAGADLTASEPARPTVIFDRRYLAAHDEEYLRTRVWHMLAEHKPQMPHFRGKLTEPQVRAIVEYLKSL